MQLDRRFLTRLGAALTALLVSQLLFWSMLYLGERAVFPQGAHYAPSLSMRALTSDDEVAEIGTIAVPLHPAPVYLYRAPTGTKRAVFSYDFQLSSDTGPNALYLSWSRRVSEVRLNGSALTARAPLDIWSVLGGFDPVLYDLPSELVQTDNLLEFEVYGVANKILPVFFVGELDALFNAYAWAQLISVDLVVAAIGVMLFVALICGITPWSGNDQRRVRSLVVLLILWSLRNLSFFGFDAAIPPPWRQVLHYQLTYAFLISVAWFAASWSNQQWLSWRWYASLFVGLAVLSFAVALLGGNVAVFDWLFPIESFLTFVLVSVAMLQLCRYAAAGAWGQRYEAVLFLVCLSAVLVDALDDRYDLSIPFNAALPLTFYAAPVCGLLLALGSCTILVSQSQRARRMLESLNELLDGRLKAQELALQVSHERERLAASEHAILEERQRLMRDMHDGLGGQLVALLARLRGGLGTRLDAASEVEKALDDLRLIVTSLDQADENLGVALGAFRERLEPRLADPDLELVWIMDEAAAAHRMPVERMLNLLRILQEACANALKYARASQLCVAIEQMTPDELRAEVRDNGVGIEAGGPSGKGLANMGIRARKLGGQIEIHSGRNGTTVSVRFPIEQPADGVTAN